MRLEGREIGRHRGTTKRVVLRADHGSLQIGHLIGHPPHAGHVVDWVHLAGRDQGRGIRRQVARQQRGHQHARLVGDGLHRRPGVAAQHHDELDIVLENELRCAGPRLLGRVLVVVGDELEGAGVVPDLDAAGGVSPSRPRSHTRTGPADPKPRPLRSEARGTRFLTVFGGSASGRGNQTAREGRAGRGRTEKGTSAYPLLKKLL